MQYVGRAIGSVSKTWSSINPATLSGAIDIIVIEQENGELACSPFHVRFGKFQLLRPSQKKVEFIVNGEPTNLPMKLGEGGEAFFVFETEASIPRDLRTSPVLSAASSPSTSPLDRPGTASSLQEPEPLELGQAYEEGSPRRASLAKSEPPLSPSVTKRLSMQQVADLREKLTVKNIPSKVDPEGNIVLDMQGYKSNHKDIENSDNTLQTLLKEEFGPDMDLSEIIGRDDEGNIRIAHEDCMDDVSISPPGSPRSNYSSNSDTTTHFKSLRLTSEQLKCLSLKPGCNDVKFVVVKNRSVVTCRLFLWKWNNPIVISDIDGTITKSDALGHVLTMFGRDWTHPGVARLFRDIELNGYNIMYLTARSVGQADSTRYYLENIDQENVKLPSGPVILSPDRTMAALHREVILKKPEVFKMACLNDIKSLFDSSAVITEAGNESRKTPFYAGFGNRITDALSYRSVGIPSSRIFTINPDGDVHMELLELAGYRSSYLHISELVDHFFPPVKVVISENNPIMSNDERFTDLNYWRDPIMDVSDLSEDSEEEKLRESTRRKVEAPQITESESSESSEDYEDSSDELVDLDDEDDEPQSPSKRSQTDLSKELEERMSIESV